MSELEKAKFNLCLRMGDSALILGHRLSEWCGHGPQLEEDIALINVSLDFVGLATNVLNYAGKIEQQGRTEDDLAFKRGEREFRNFLITEQPNGDYAFTIVRQFLYDAYCHYFFEELVNSKDEQLSAIAQKATKEVTYHLRHSSEWLLRLGDGTTESHTRTQNALNELWMYTGDMFAEGTDEKLLLSNGIGVDLQKIKLLWDKKVAAVLQEATLEIPSNVFMQQGSRDGVHTEHLGFLLAEMQYLQRVYPNATW